MCEIYYPEADVLSLESLEDVRAPVHGVPYGVDDLVDWLEVANKSD